MLAVSVIRWGGFACMVGGLLHGLGFLLNRSDISTLPNAIAAVLYLSSLPLLLLGLAALYLQSRGSVKTGRLYLLLGPLISVTGLLLLSLSSAAFFALGLVGFLGGLVALSYGLVTVGIANTHRNALGRLSAAPVLIGVLIVPLALIGGYAANSASSAGELAQLAMGLLWSAAWALLGYSLWVDGGVHRDELRANAGR